MAQKVINLGTAYDDTSATHGRDALSDFQDNFTELYGLSVSSNYLTKKLTGTLNATEGVSTNIAHGLTQSKIISFTVLVNNSIIPNSLIPSAHYCALLDNTYVIIRTYEGYSSDIVSGNVIVYIVYES
jgi:hypothetical protein